MTPEFDMENININLINIIDILVGVDTIFLTIYTKIMITYVFMTILTTLYTHSPIYVVHLMKHCFCGLDIADVASTRIIKTRHSKEHLRVVYIVIQVAFQDSSRH
jgi:hypothetical protein